MDRETTTLTTPKGAELKVKTYLTAKERNALRGVYLSTMKIDGAGTVTDGLNGSVLEAAEHKLIEVSVLSYAGSTENILARLLEERPEEYDFVVTEAGKTNPGNFQQAK